MIQQLEALVPRENLPQVELIVEQAVGQVVHHSGPLPRAAELARYQQIDATFAERIVRMAEREQEFRHSLPRQVVQHDFALRSRGQIFALTLATVILLFAAYLGWLGDTAMAAAVAIGTLVGIVGIFVTGRVIEAKERAKDGDA